MGFDLDLYLPEGIEVATDRRGKFQITAGSRYDDHTISMAKQSDGAFRAICISMLAATFYPAEEGMDDVATVDLAVNGAIYDLQGRKVTETVKGGIYIKNGKKFIAE